jgi:hypothetical protein
LRPCPDIQGKAVFTELDVWVGFQGQNTQTSVRDPENFDEVIREMVLTRGNIGLYTAVPVIVKSALIFIVSWNVMQITHKVGAVDGLLAMVSYVRLETEAAHRWKGVRNAQIFRYLCSV